MLSVTTPLPDRLELTGLAGEEGISRLFELRLDLAAASTVVVPFDKVLGKPVTVTVRLPDGAKRFLNGICRRVSQGDTESIDARLARTAYRMEVVPQLWMLTQRTNSRIFQQQSVPDILRAALTGLSVAFELRGRYEPRDYCVQYRETDFNFVSRLMEEEGIHYFFKHADGTHTMVVADTPGSHLDVPGASTVRFRSPGGGLQPDDQIQAWETAQALTSGKVTLWDHCFELPGRNLAAETSIRPQSVTVGRATRTLKVGENDKLERYDYPGGYAGRFDGVDVGGGERPAELQKIFQDNLRTADLRMDEEAARAIETRGASNCRQLVSGHKFTLAGHGDADGAYVLTTVTHQARLGTGPLAGGEERMEYANTFTCIPAALPFRPARTTPRSVVHGSQTAVVVGPPGEEIFTDKYGRVKVQFHWDRQGKKDARSSCWVRVASIWAGRQWGAIHIPRIGQEVVVDFLEGDPDQPIIVGSVYNAEQMPPYALPQHRTQSGIKSRSSPGGSPANFNELRFEDKHGSEQVYIHAERNQDIEVENDETHSVGHDRTKSVEHDESVTVGNNRTESVGKNESITIGDSRTEAVEKNESISIGVDRSVSVGKNENLDVGASRTTTIAKNETVTVGEKRATDVGKDDVLQVGKKLIVQAGDEIVLKTGDATITMKKDGTITIKGKDITLQGSGKINAKASSDVVIKGSKVLAN